LAVYYYSSFENSNLFSFYSERDDLIMPLAAMASTLYRPPALRPAAKACTLYRGGGGTQPFGETFFAERWL
jgi:hypothetical protein